MNHYHIYEAIGRGKYSTVYKGREKKTIEYFAVKSVDKSQKSNVLQEVRVLHSLDHPNVLKFHSWYETSAHLWLVLEYCVGGDLMTLLHQDGKLPEESVHDLSYGLVRGLQFLHSKGIIYCDLKPSNILLDENGRTKLCDFGLARKLGDISKSRSSLAKRGTPFYMAPELFQDGGVNSYASDLWALGCVLYECYTGSPPFMGKELTQLMKSILLDATPPIPGSPSRPFVNLINSLLVKDPAERIQWPELCRHAFWGTKFTPIPLPHQPAFTSMIDLSSKPCLSEHNNKTPPKYREKDSKESSILDENSILGSKGYGTPVKGISSGRKILNKAGVRVTEDKQKGHSSGNRGVNLLRLSRIAKSNLQKENEKENYRRPMPNSSENDAEVQIENTDMELDFDENNEDETPDETDGSDNPACTLEEKLLTPKCQHGNTFDIDNNINQFDSPMRHVPSADDTKMNDHEASSEQPDVSATPPSVSPQLKSPKPKEGSACAFDFDYSKSSDNSISEMLWHPSDFSVRPVMPNRKAAGVPESLPWPPFDSLSAFDFTKMSKEQLDVFNSKVIAIFNGSSSISEKQNVIRYLEMLSSTAGAANLLTNGPIMLVLVKMLRLSKASALRAQLTSLIALLIRHAIIIEDDLSHSGILGSLTDGLRDKQEKVRRFSMAALGELLFYIATQNEHGRDSSPAESPSKDNRPASGWQVSSSLISLVSSMLKKGEDDVTQLYALKTIENICSQAGHWVARFTSQDVINNLCYIFRAAGKQESARLTAGSCLVRLACFNPPSIQSVVEKLSFKDIASSLVKGNPREQQICLNLLNLAMIAGHLFTNIGRHLVPLAEDKHLVPNLLSLVEQGSEVLRGKSLVLVALLCKNSRRWLPHFFCNQRLLSTVDKLVKEKDTYVRQCVDAFLHVVASVVPVLLEIITGDIHQIMGGKRHLHIAALTSRTTPRTNIHLFPVVLHLLGSSSFKHRVATHQVVVQLANLVKLIESPFQGRDDFQITLLRVLESIAEEASVILEQPEMFSRKILPSLFVLYKGNKDGDARFLCLKILFDVVVIFLNGPPNSADRLEDLKSISNAHFLSLYPTLIEDEDPIPVYAQKLLVMLIEFDCIKIRDILELKIISWCFEFLLGDLPSANVNSVKLCLALASAPEMDPNILSQLKVVRRIGNLLAYANAREMEDFIEPTLGLCRAFLLRSDHQPPCIKDIMDFGSSMSIFLDLSGSRETSIADLASECVVLLLKAAPREATTGFLTSLPKVSALFEAWQSKGISQLVVQRMLHALGFSCRQYLSHAMILSLSMPDISKIEAIVSQMKNSKIGGVADLAFLVASELQRLPRCI